MSKTDGVGRLDHFTVEKKEKVPPDIYSTDASTQTATRESKTSTMQKEATRVTE